MEVTTLFLMLASMMIRACKGTLKDLIAKLSNCWMHILELLSFCLLNEWKEKWLGKMLITLWLGENSEWRGKKEGNNLLNLLSMSTNGPLTKLYCHLMRNPSEDGC